jgi:hypothetical protein
LSACDRGEVLTRGRAPKKTSTLATDRGRIERHIKPLLGAIRVRDLTTDDCQRFVFDVAAGKSAADVKTRKQGRAIVEGGRGTATRTAGLLGGILAYAVKTRLRPDNPARGIERFKDGARDRFLSADELARLGAGGDGGRRRQSDGGCGNPAPGTDRGTARGNPGAAVGTC